MVPAHRRRKTSRIRVGYAHKRDRCEKRSDLATKANQPSIRPTQQASSPCSKPNQLLRLTACALIRARAWARGRLGPDTGERVRARFRIHAIPETDMFERDIRDIPLSQLELAPDNVRKTPADASAFTELKASITAHGLLENLIVRAMEPGLDWRRALRRDRRRAAAGRDAGAGRRRRAGRGPPLSVTRDMSGLCTR